MSRLIKLVIIACCLFLTTGCVFSSGKKEMPEKNAQRILTIEDIKNADASFLNEKYGAGDKKAPLTEKPKPPALPQKLEKPPVSEEKDTINQADTDDTTMFKSAPEPSEALKTEQQPAVNQNLDKITQRLKNLEAYSQKTRDLAGENRHLLRRVLPDTNTAGLTGYKNGQIELSQAQKKWLEENIIAPYLTNKIYDVELTGYADTAPVKKNARYTLDDFPELRIKEIVNYIKERGADVANIKILKGRVTDEFGNNRRVQFDYKNK